MIRRLPVPGRFLLGVVFASGLAALATGRAAEEPKYPRVSVATGYKVDPSWPRRPKGVEWGAVSGIAVDRNDRVYVFTRAKPPVQVYDEAGKFLHSWGEDEIKSPHHIRVGPDGNVWLTDIGHHTVQQWSPNGRLL